MLKENYQSVVTEYVIYPPTFIDCVPVMESSFKQKIRKAFEQIVKIDSFLKNNFLCIHKNVESSKAKLPSCNKKAEFTVVAYPESDIQEVLNIMNTLKVTSISVMENPWSKNFLGYVDKTSIQKKMDDKCKN